MQIGIVGGGLVGYLLACSLHRKKHDITVITAADYIGSQSAAYAAAGMLSPLLELENSEPLIYQLGMDSLPLWKTLLPSFRQNVFQQFSGSIITAHPNDRSELSRFIRCLKAKLPTCDVEKLEEDKLKIMEPELNFSFGYFSPDEGQLSSRMLMCAMADELSEHQVTMHCKTRATEVAPRAVYTHDGCYHFDIVFDCRGHQATDAFDDLRAVRGELIYLHAPEVKISRPIRLLHPRYNIYIAPRPNSVYLIGASEIESHDDSPISVRTCLELLTAAYSVVPGFSEARIIETVTGLRPALKSNLPVVKHQDGLIAINGLYRHGFLIAPAIINDVLTLVEQGEKHLKYPEIFIGESQ